LRGAATVIARQDGRYAFYRGTTSLGQPELPNQLPNQQGQQLQYDDFLQNLNESNDMIQDDNIKGWDSLRRGKGGKGVEVQEAY
jgi:hypothetical protein